MVSLYDVFYIIAKHGTISVRDIVKELGKDTLSYQNVFNNVLILERKKLVKREKDKTVHILHNPRAQQLFDLISFCLHNMVNYNVLFKDKMLEFLHRATRKEFFTNEDIKIHAETFRFYCDSLSKYGLLIIISRNPFTCKLLKSQVITDVLTHFGKKPMFYTAKKRTHAPDITRELRKYRLHVKTKMAPVLVIEKSRETGFIYSSLHLEGNPLTLPETERLLIEHVVPEKQRLESIEETVNYKKCVETMIERARKKIALTISLMLNYHAIAMRQKDFAGKIRTENVFIKKNAKFITSDWKEINKKLATLMHKYVAFENAKQTVDEVITFAAYFHNEFQRIHPFIDGNSRIARVLMLHILRAHGFPVLELPIGYFDSYLDLTKRSQKRDDAQFTLLVEEIVLTNLKNINNTIKGLRK